MARGDAALMAERWEDARVQYARAGEGMGKAQALMRKNGRDIEGKLHALGRDLALRNGIYDSPEGCVKAALKFAGSGQADNLMVVFWDLPGLAELGLGRERWQEMSEETKKQFCNVATALVISRLDMNREFFAKVEQEYTFKRMTGDKATLEGWMIFARSKLGAKIELKRCGPIWKIVDVYAEFLEASMSEMLSKSIKHLESLRPIDETLAQSDALALLEQSFNIAVEDAGSNNGLKARVVAIKMDVILVTDQGERKPLHAGMLMRLMGPARIMDGKKEILVQPVIADRLNEEGETISATTTGWISEDALPVTDEGTLWVAE